MSGFFVVITLLWHNWIEILFGIEPDGGDGSLEWALVGVLIMVTVVFFVVARIEWRRAVARQPGACSGRA